MAPGVFASEDLNNDFSAKLTGQVFLCSIIAAFGGLMFGYDIGVSGGVTSMDDFLRQFFPRVFKKKHHAKEDNYCKFDDQNLQLFTSSLYLSAIVFSFLASIVCKKFGRKPAMQAASAFFLVGVLLTAAAQNVVMLIIGRICLGAGIGFGNQAVPLFISEIAPPKYRGGLNICFQLLITIGILVANLVNYYSSKVKGFGWRISMAGAAIPAIALAFGSLFILETPTSLIERGHKEKGKENLKKIRASDDVDREYKVILRATELANQVKHPFRNLMKRSSRPQLVCGTILQIFQQFTGINVIMFYAPVLFQTMGFGSNASLLSAVVTGSVNVAATLVAVFGVDFFGRKGLLIEAALQMLICQFIMGIIFLLHLQATNMMPPASGKLVLILICVFVAGFAWSWGPLGWLIPSEIYPLETRSAGFFFAVSMNMFCTFIIAQAFLTMLCHMQWGIFFFFSGMIVIMGTFAIFFLPETKGVPIDEMNERRWKKHWYWKRYFNGDDYDNNNGGNNNNGDYDDNNGGNNGDFKPKGLEIMEVREEQAESKEIVQVEKEDNKEVKDIQEEDREINLQ